MSNSLFELKEAIVDDLDNNHDLISIVQVFLLGVMSTSVDLVEINHTGSAPIIYADVEAAAKEGGMRSIEKMKKETGSTTYSVSKISPDDMTAAMNYLGDKLSSTLFKGLYELPMPLRKTETMLRAIEALLANLLNQKFNNAHVILDDLCAHVHMALNDLEQRRH
jgi:hypothetical protein